MKIIISGGSKGLGLALATYLAKDHEITTFSRTSSRSLITGVNHINNIDVNNKEDLDSLSSILSECDGLINNVGIAYDGILATQSFESIHSMVETNLLSVIYLTKLYIRSRLPIRKGGNVVSISSIISNRGFSGLATYSATKGAINSMTRALARELGGKGFRFNSVLPGYFESDMSKNLSEEKKNQIIRRTPLGRLANTNDICPVVEFLLSDYSGFITGQEITIDGGLTC